MATTPVKPAPVKTVVAPKPAGIAALPRPVMLLGIAAALYFVFKRKGR